MAIHKLISHFLLIQTYHTTCVSLPCEFYMENMKMFLAMEVLKFLGCFFFFCKIELRVC